ncbi:MAG: PDZ domain-containing protein [Bacteroidales bacterium]|nr:PDZ domain-containing protein [Bacteroidales bacterium]
MIEIVYFYKIVAGFWLQVYMKDRYLNIRPFWFFFIFLVLPKISLFDFSQSLYAQDQWKIMSFVNPRAKTVSFPFKFINNLIIIPVIINDSDTLHFILDTGLSTTIMTELSMGDTLSLMYSRQVKLKGLGEGEPVDAIHSYGNIFYISGIKGINQDLLILLQNVFNLSSIFGTRVHGLMGYNIFRNFIVEIDYHHKIISFHNPEYYKPRRKRKRTITLPLTIHNTKPYLVGTIILADNTEVPVKLLLDTGASHALWLDTKSHPGLKFPEKVADSYLGRGLSGDIYGKLGKIHGFSLGGFFFSSPIVAFPDSASVGNSSGLDDRNGSLGSEILRRFHVIIDYPNKQITFTPNNNFKNPFKLNRSGIDLEAPIPELPYYIISNIRKESPADRAGLKKGDELQYINNKNIRLLTINDIYNIFQDKAGKKIKLTISRGVFSFKVILYLEDFI